MSTTSPGPSTIQVETGKDSGGFLLAVAMLLIFLKLIGLIAWSWLWVLLPLWIAPVLAIAAFTIVGAILVAVLLVAAIATLTSKIIQSFRE